MPKLDRTCSICYKKGPVAFYRTCPRCKAVNYCSDECQAVDSDPASTDCHATWCSNLQLFLRQAISDMEFPFQWSLETTSSEFNTKSYASFLSRHGVLGEGLWRIETHEPFNGEFGDEPLTDNPLVLPSESVVMEDDIDSFDSKDVACWADYYRWRGIHLESPICILMQWPLTIYHILRNCLQSDYVPIERRCRWTIHIVGAEKETDLIPVFWELGHLLPRQDFDLTFIGPSIAGSANHKVMHNNRMKITLRRGLYHEIIDLPSPDLVVGFNAGLPAYNCWFETIKLLTLKRIPAYFTEYCWRSYEFTRRKMEKSRMTKISSGSLNPFRCPIRIQCLETELPQFSNAVLFHLEYDRD